LDRCVLFPKVSKQELVVPCALWAFDATPGNRYKLRVTLVERCIFQEHQHVRLNPETQIADRKENPGGSFRSVCVNLFEASCQPTRLHLRWQLRQQNRMADADVILIERSSGLIAQVGQFQPGGLCYVVAYVASRVEGIAMVPFSHLKTT
jgi:hypothetical protein